MATERPIERPFKEIQVSLSEIEIRKIGMKDVWQALQEGFDDFVAKPSHFVFLLVFYPLIILLLTLILIGHTSHLAFPTLVGLTFLGPLVSVGLFEISRGRERGLQVTWGSAFDFVHTSAFAPILALSIVMVMLYFLWLFFGQLIYFGLFGTDPPLSISHFANEVLTTRRGGGLIVYGTAVGFIFAVAAFSISVVGFPLLLDKPVSAITAATASVRAVLANPLVMTAWALIVVGLLLLGLLLFLIGLAVVLPILGHATWHLYRKLVAP